MNRKPDASKMADILYRHYKDESLSASEKLLLEAWLQDAANREMLEQLRDENEFDQYLSMVMDHRHTEEAFQQFRDNNYMPSPAPRVPLLKRTWFRYAAAILVVLGVGTIWFYTQRNTAIPGTATMPAQQADVAPGRVGAILTLADGSKMILDSMPDGIIAQQDAAKIILSNGQLSYNPQGATASAVSYNTMTTPKGRQFKIVLPDGSRVWLNAQSSIHYPTVFHGNERRVNITGEAYFEIAKNAKAPFYVNINEKAEVLVLGTSFNINAYDNEPALRTTLLEGSIRIMTKERSQLLQPGQQVKLDVNGKIIELIDKPGIDKIIAWKNGYFDFNDANLYEVTRQLERWYNIEIEYEKNIPPVEFRGKLQRDLSLSQILRILEKMNVKFTIEDGKKLIITKPA